LLLGLPLGVDFKPFTRTDPKSAKKTDGLTVFFAILESLRVKALGEIDP